MNINEENEAILEDFKRLAKEKEDDYIVEDGLPYCGKIVKKKWHLEENFWQ